MDTYRSISTRVVIASLLGALATFAAPSAKADTATAGACDPQSLTCTVGTAPSLSGQIKFTLKTGQDCVNVTLKNVTYVTTKPFVIK